MRVLVSGLFSPVALFAVRRFAQLGLEVTAADNHRLAFGMYSKYANKRILLPSLRDTPDAYARDLLRELEEHDYDYYFPGFEEGYLLSQHRERLDRCVKHTLPEYVDVMRLHDKATFGEVALAAGVKYPKTFVPNTLEEAHAAMRHIDYPVYIKMRSSCNSIGLTLVEDPKELQASYDAVVAQNQTDPDNLPILQQRVEGSVVALTALAQEGRTITRTLYRAARTIPRSGGTTTARITVEDAICAEACTKIVEHLGWTGFIGVDAVLDRQSGEVYAIECNPRPTFCLHLAQQSGIDMLPAWVSMADRKRVEKMPDCRPNIKSATDFADIIWLGATYVVGPESRADRASMRQRWWADRRDTTYDIFDSADAKPFLVLLVFLAVQTLRLLFTKHQAAELYVWHNVFLAPRKAKPVAQERSRRSEGRGPMLMVGETKAPTEIVKSQSPGQKRSSAQG